MAPVGLSLLGNRLAEAMSSGEIKFTYLDGTVISGRFEVEGVFRSHYPLGGQLLSSLPG